MMFPLIFFRLLPSGYIIYSGTSEQISDFEVDLAKKSNTDRDHVTELRTHKLNLTTMV